MSRRREPLPFKLVGMTEDELYDIVAEIEDDCASIPSDRGSDNDSDAEEEQEGIISGMQVDANNVLDTNEDEVALSASDSESSDEWDADDTVPLATLAQEYRNNNKISWGNDLSNIKSAEPFVSNAGLPQFIQDRADLSPYEAFNLLITDDILNHIVFQTNLYAEQQFQVTGKQYNKTDIMEVKTFLGMNLLMSIKKYPSYRDHWSTSPDLHDPYISKLMTLHRFGWLLSHIHLNDNSVIPERGSANFDKLYRVRPFLESLRANFQECLQPHENIAMDESMIKFKGRSSLKQYMPKKPVKRGYKVWVLADETGYCWNFEIYTGKTGNEVEKNLGARVVKTLAAPVANKNHKLFFDNFFASVGLMQDLLQEKLFACGTVNMTRKYLPKFKLDKLLKRGEYEWYSSNTGLAAVKWRDKRSVHLISNYHNPTIVTEVRRKEKDGTFVQVPCPMMLTDYRNMNFVDKFDQRRACYGVDRKSHKWWHRIFFFFLDTGLVNAFTIYKLYHNNHEDLSKVTLKDFRRRVSEGLVANTFVRKTSLPLELSKTLKNHKPSVSEAVRLTESMHQPIRTTRRICAFCSTKKNEIRTNWQCNVCQVPLCLGKTKACFQSYHRT